MITTQDSVFVVPSTARSPFLVRVLAAATESASPRCEQCGLCCVPIPETVSGAGAELVPGRYEGALGLEWATGVMAGVCGWCSTSTTQWKVGKKGTSCRSGGRNLERKAVYVLYLMCSKCVGLQGWKEALNLTWAQLPMMRILRFSQEVVYLIPQEPGVQSLSHSPSVLLSKQPPTICHCSRS